MTTSELTAVDRVQNPAFGALLLWRFANGFQLEKPDQRLLLPLLFLLLPLTLHRKSLDVIRSTNVSSGLIKFVSKLGEERENLIAVHERTLALRNLTMESLATGICTDLLRLEYDTGLVHACEARAPSTSERLKYHLASAEKLGRWFSRLPPSNIFILLKVEV